MIASANEGKKSRVLDWVGSLVILGIGVGSLVLYLRGYRGFLEDTPLTDLPKGWQEAIIIVHTLVFMGAGSYFTFRSLRRLSASRSEKSRPAGGR